MQATDAYSRGFLSKDIPTELDRLRALEAWADPVAKDMIERLSIEADWRCLEMGAGAGSMAYWMAERCPQGRVIAADIDPRYLDGGRARNLEIAKMDLVRDDFPAKSLDLIHSRLVLSHLPERDDVLKRAVQWLKPGGAILVEDYYILPVEELSDALPKLGYDICDRVMRTFQAQGSDTRYGRKIARHLGRLGVGELEVRMTPTITRDGAPSMNMWRIMLEQFLVLAIEKKWLPLERAVEFSEYWPADAVEIPWFLVSVSGRRL